MVKIIGGKYSAAVHKSIKGPRISTTRMSVFHGGRFFFCLFEGILGSASGAEFPVSLSNHVSFTPRLLYSSTHHSK